MRALGLLELAPGGKAHLLPVAILVDGKFYDASAYKADPVPMSLYSETVYEAERTGISQGLFIVTGALQTKDTWIGEGKWQPGGSTTVKARHSESKPRMDEDEGPPRLRQRGADKSSPPIAQPSSSPSDTPASAPPATASGTAPAATPAGAPSNSPPLAEASTVSPDENDPNRPVLKRGKTQPIGATHGSSPSATSSTPTTTLVPPLSTASSTKPDKASGVVQLIPAISDAAGPEPRPYTYDLQPSEERSYRKKMLVLATAAVQARARQIVPALPGSQPKQGTAARLATGKQPQPAFDDIQFRAFDLWNTNQPVFILSAKALTPAEPRSSEPSSNLTYYITVVAKADIYGDVQKLLVNTTDSQHLDEIPRMELIDAVDADGDGRGELLFRQVWDTGVAWAVYRAAADQLYPLFEGTPSSQ